MTDGTGVYSAPGVARRNLLHAVFMAPLAISVDPRQRMGNARRSRESRVARRTDIPGIPAVGCRDFLYSGLVAGLAIPHSCKRVRRSGRPPCWSRRQRRHQTPGLMSQLVTLGAIGLRGLRRPGGADIVHRPSVTQSYRAIDRWCTGRLRMVRESDGNKSNANSPSFHHQHRGWRRMAAQT